MMWDCTYLHNLDIVIGECDVSVTPLRCSSHTLPQVVLYVECELFDDNAGLTMEG